MQFHDRGLRIGEVSCPTRYFDEASSIGFRRAVRYGLGVLVTCAQYLLHRTGLHHASIFGPPPALPERTPGSGSEADGA